MKKHAHPYHRFSIETKKEPNILPHPQRFRVKVNKLGLAKLLLKEMVHYRGNMGAVMSRPCVYGVFSGPLGGFAPREKLCVGCLRCTTEHPDFVSILPNPERAKLGDEYFTPDYVDTLLFEAETGHIPIKGQGYRGKFGGTGWDGMWTDMSEIVRPTRDGIHGREFISTVIDIGGNAPFLEFPLGSQAINHSIPIPLLFDAIPTSILDHRQAISAVCEAARHLQTFAIVPIETLMKFSMKGAHLIPLITPENRQDLSHFDDNPSLVEVEGDEAGFLANVKRRFPHSQIILRIPFDEERWIAHYQKGERIFHLTANYHGRDGNGKFILAMIREAHRAFVKRKCRGEVTLLGSGGIIAAEHLPKALICGLDAVALDTAILVALQAQFAGPCIERQESRFKLPRQLTVEWGAQRLKNLVGSWRDQLLEILGAMGLREVRRMRGEVGRALFQNELEREAFAGIEGYEPQ